MTKEYYNQNMLEHALDHLDELADQTTESYEEKKEQEKSYTYLLSFIRQQFKDK